MSEKYAPNLDRVMMEQILREEDTGVLAMVDGQAPYAVPLSYIWIEGRILIHCSAKGYKLEILRQNPRVCFTVFRHPDRVKPHPEGECHYRFESVICFGQARLIDDPAERLPLLERFKREFYQRLGMPPEKDPVNLRAAEKCGCILIDVEEMTGRKKD